MTNKVLFVQVIRPLSIHVRFLRQSFLCKAASRTASTLCWKGKNIVTTFLIGFLGNLLNKQAVEYAACYHISSARRRGPWTAKPQATRSPISLLSEQNPA